MTLALLLLIVALVIFVVDAYLHKSLVSVGLAFLTTAFIISSGGLHLG